MTREKNNDREKYGTWHFIAGSMVAESQNWLTDQFDSFLVSVGSLTDHIVNFSFEP